MENGCSQGLQVACEKRLSRIETTLDTVMFQNEKIIEQHERRISSLEKWRSYILGALAVIGVALANGLLKNFFV